MQVKVLPVPGGADIQAYVFGDGDVNKTLVVTAGVHGCEYVGIQTLLTLIRELEHSQERLHGRVILIPIVNEAGFYDGVKRVVPGDGKNLNQAFPGKKDGTLTERMAEVLERELYPEADFILDLHSGDVNERLTPLVFCPVAGISEVNEAARQAAAVLQVPYCVSSTAKSGFYSWAVQRGIPALLLERGCQGVWSEEEVCACRRDVYALMQHLGIWQKTAETAVELADGQHAITRAAYIEAPVTGFWYPGVSEGQPIHRGDLIGELRTMQNHLIEQYHAEFDGVVLYYTVSLGVKAGDNLAAIGAL